ncbi:MAG: hypothetical protein QMC96_12935 [Methanomicrobiales archaeon]|nr:hypothetical protein [Methanomicrobiales archaeon]
MEQFVQHSFRRTDFSCEVATPFCTASGQRCRIPFRRAFVSIGRTCGDRLHRIPFGTTIRGAGGLQTIAF